MSSTTESCPCVNVGQFERTLSIIGGSVMVLKGLRSLSLSGLVMAGLGSATIYRGLTGHCQVYKTLGINTLENQTGVQQGIKIEKCVIIDKPRTELYNFWRRFENLPMVMSNIVSVEQLSPGRSQWTARGPLDKKVTWEAEIINEKQDELIAWQSIHDSDVQCAGSVSFEDAPDGATAVYVNLQYMPPAGKLGAAVARLFGDDPAAQVMSDLLNFKRAMESSGSSELLKSEKDHCDSKKTEAHHDSKPEAKHDAKPDSSATEAKEAEPVVTH